MPTPFFPLSAGLDEEGLYRKPGILSKANKLVKDAIERGKVDSIELGDECEWDTKTIASAVKNFFGKQMGEPLLTFRLHRDFIEAASKWAVFIWALFSVTLKWQLDWCALCRGTISFLKETGTICDVFWCAS